MLNRLEEFDSQNLQQYVTPPRIRLMGVGGAGLGVAGGDDRVEVRMGGTEPQQFGPGEPRGPDDLDGSHPESIQSSVCSYNIFMHDGECDGRVVLDRPMGRPRVRGS